MDAVVPGQLPGHTGHQPGEEIDAVHVGRQDHVHAVTCGLDVRPLIGNAGLVQHLVDEPGQSVLHLVLPGAGAGAVALDVEGEAEPDLTPTSGFG
ncbi:hypothetical protein GCM10027074_67460 [Streptomyces deserti]